jgi:hypothetical protein
MKPQLLTMEQIAAQRSAGFVTAREEARAYARPEQFAVQCGLFADPKIYGEIPLGEALAVLQAILHRDMAYGVELAPLADARAMAHTLLADYMTGPARYFTNGDYGKPQLNPNTGTGWNAATDSTFDTGVLVLAEHKSLCFWVEDED